MQDLAARVRALQGAFPAYAEMLGLAHDYIQSDAAGSLTKSRTVLELVLGDLYAAEMGKEPRKAELGAILNDNQFTRRVDRRIWERMDGVRGMGNAGTHGHPVRASDAERALDDLCEVLLWYRQRRGGYEPTNGHPAEAGAVPGSYGLPLGRVGEGPGTARIELHIEGDFDSFTPEKQEHVLRAIKELMSAAGDIRVVSKRPGSVRLTLELTAEQAEELLGLVNAGRLTHVGVRHARLLPPGGDEEGVGAPAGQDPADAGLRSLLRRVDSLPDDFREIRQDVRSAVALAGRDPEMALARTRKVLDLVVREVYERRVQEPPGIRPLANLMQRLVHDGHLPGRLKGPANAVRLLGDVGTHHSGQPIRVEDALVALSGLMEVLEWYIGEEPDRSALKSTRPGPRAGVSEPTHRPLRSRTERGVLVLTVTVPNVLKDEVADALRGEFLAAAAGADRVVVDMQNVASFGSQGLRALLQLQRAVKGRGGRVVLCHLADSVKQVLQVTGLVSTSHPSRGLLEEQPDVDAAIVSLSRPA
jgi:anti-anti-sigma factor